MNHREFRTAMLRLSRRIAQTYPDGFLETNCKLVLSINVNSIGTITVKETNGGRGIVMRFNSDNWSDDLAIAERDIFPLWRATRAAFR